MPRKQIVDLHDISICTRYEVTIGDPILLYGFNVQQETGPRSGHPSMS